MRLRFGVGGGLRQCWDRKRVGRFRRRRSEAALADVAGSVGAWWHAGEIDSGFAWLFG